MTDKNDKLTVYDESLTTVTDKIRKAITKKHKNVSSLNTPKPFVKKKMGMEYVEFSYMREIADQEYPGWSWTIEKTDVLGSEAYVVHGRLKWFDEGIWRLGDMCAAHRIQKKRGTDEFVDIGNDVKASNTDCIKKAFNFYLNICDDVYRNQVDDLTLSDEQKDKIIEVAGMAGDERRTEIADLINEQVIHSGNYKSSFAKLEREAGI
tara:strand:+ start:1483 stop:2103 length:621 start_codon:yes stop_codon:yes gene_type:complete